MELRGVCKMIRNDFILSTGGLPVTDGASIIPIINQLTQFPGCLEIGPMEWNLVPLIGGMVGDI